jgi:NAD(P)-dependent dehydrogenase (short-subunit alcohol dehydrogenase family)
MEAYEFEQFDCSGKVVLVTGGSRGLGKAMAEGLGDAGAKVAIVARREKWLNQAAADLRDRGISTIAEPCDILEEDQMREVVDRVEDEWGGIDVLVNNAGITWGAPALEMPMEKWRDVLEVNLTGTFIVTRIVGERMLERGSGSIINISSVGGMRGLDASVQEAIGYNTSKGGLISFTRDLATKWAADGVRVNALVPGMFPTRMTEWMEGEAEEAFLEETPMGRPAELDEIKGPAVFLASDAASYVTGQVLPVDGGTTL